MRTAKTLIRLGIRPVSSESSLGAQSFCWFCHGAAQVYFTPNKGTKMSQPLENTNKITFNQECARATVSKEGRLLKYLNTSFRLQTRNDCCKAPIQLRFEKNIDSMFRIYNYVVENWKMNINAFI